MKPMRSLACVLALVVLSLSLAAVPAQAASASLSLSPAEGHRKVMVLVDFHLVQPAAAARLLKTIEEPPASTFFVVLVEDVTPDLVTLASRCVRIDPGPVPSEAIVSRLVSESVPRDCTAQAVASPAAEHRRALGEAAEQSASHRAGGLGPVPAP